MGKDIQEDKGMLQEVDRKLRLLIGAFTGILYEDDDIFMEKMRRKKNLPEEELQLSLIHILYYDFGASFWN